MNVETRIKEQYTTFSKTNKRIAEFILNDPERFLEMTALETAKVCETSSASVIRFTKNLGYKGLDEFKIELARSSHNNKKTYDVDTIISKDDSIQQICEKLESLVGSTTEELFSGLTVEQISQAIDLIYDAKEIYILGIGTSMLPAFDFYHKLKRVNKRAHYEFDAHMAIEFFNFITEDDVVIAFSYSGITKEIIYPCNVALNKGAKVISITRDGPSPLRDLSDIVLSVPNKENLLRVGAISSKLSAMIIEDLLYLGIAQKDPNMFEEELINTGLLTSRLKED